MTPQEYQSFITADIGRWGAAVKASGAKVD
jgi:hypothetical protein